MRKQEKAGDLKKAGESRRHGNPAMVHLRDGDTVILGFFSDNIMIFKAKFR